MLVILSEAKNPSILLGAARTLEDCRKSMNDHTYYVYILSNVRKRLYTGVTNNLQDRVYDHKHPDANSDAFTARYKIDQLVYFERFQYVTNAIAREKEIKGWNRIKKVALIVAENPTWRDLSEDWGKPTEPFDQSKMRPPETF